MQSALKTDHIKLANPISKQDRKVLAEWTARTNGARCVTAALTYALLSEKVFLDGVNENLYEKSARGISVRPIIDKTTDGFDSLVGFTDSQDNNVRTLFETNERRANLYSTLEPMIWQSFQRSSSGVPRSALRTALDIIVLHPELVKTKTVESKVIIRKSLQEKWSLKRPDRELVSELEYVAHKAIIRGSIAANVMEEAIRRNAINPGNGLSFGVNRQVGQNAGFQSFEHNKIITSVRIFLDEIKYWPKVTTVSDVLSIRNNKSFVEFRMMLRSWVEAVCSGNFKDEQRLRTEIKSANKALSSAVVCGQVGRWFAYLGLPLVVVDQCVAPYFGALASVVGFGLQAYSDWQRWKHRWICIGK
jgi:hypothetical protein